MATWKNVEFTIPKQTDKQIVAALRGIFDDSEYDYTTVQLYLSFGPNFTVTAATIDEDEKLNARCCSGGVLLKNGKIRPYVAFMYPKEPFYSACPAVFWQTRVCKSEASG